MFNRKEYSRKYYLTNKDRIKTKVRQYKEEHKEWKKRVDKEYRQKPYVKLRHRGYNKRYIISEKGKKTRKKYYETNKKEILRKSKEYRNRPKVKERYKKIKKEYHKRTYPLNRERLLKYSREREQRPEVKVRRKLQKQVYYQGNRDGIKLKQQQYRKKPRTKELERKRLKDYHKDPKNKDKIKIWTRNGNKQRKIKENKRRKKLGLPLIGEGYRSQKELLVYVKQLFPSQRISFNKIVLDNLQLDIYIPDLKLGFEYQGYQHYLYPNFHHKSLDKFLDLQKRDKRKKELCNQRGITLIEFPYYEKVSLPNVLTKLNEVNVKTCQANLVEKFKG